MSPASRRRRRKQRLEDLVLHPINFPYTSACYVHGPWRVALHSKTHLCVNVNRMEEQTLARLAGFPCLCALGRDRTVPPEQPLRAKSLLGRWTRLCNPNAHEWYQKGAGAAAFAAARKHWFVPYFPTHLVSGNLCVVIHGRTRTWDRRKRRWRRSRPADTRNIYNTEVKQ